MKKRSKVPAFRRLKFWNDLVIVAFAIASMIFLGLEFGTKLSIGQLHLLHVLDITIAFTFLADFVFRLHKAKDKRHFIIFHWWELLASIPITNTITQGLRGLRFLRILEIVAVLRVTGRLEVTGEVFGSYTKFPYVIEAFSTIIAVLFAGSVGFFALEYGHNPNVHSLWDAFWWATTTMTTTGYGDIYPVTTAGRVLAMGLMFTGLITAALLTSVMVRYLSARKR